MKQSELDYSTLREMGKLYSYITPLIATSMLLIILALILPTGNIFSQLATIFGWTLALFTVGYVAFLWWEQRYSVKEFARSNGLVPIDDATLESLTPPCIAHMGERARASNEYTLSVNDHDFVVFNYSFTIQESRARVRYTFGVMMFSMKKAFPHIYLDGKQNGNLNRYSKNQRVILEGDFNEDFDLYIPDGTHVDALSIISPDVMQTLKDGGKPYDIEIVGKQVYVMSWGSMYGHIRFPDALSFSVNLHDELAHRNVSWQPLAQVAAVQPRLRHGMSNTEMALFVLKIVAACALALWLLSIFTDK